MLVSYVLGPQALASSQMVVLTDCDTAGCLFLGSILHSEGLPERFTELHGEEKREEGDRGDQDEMRWNQNRREQASQ